MMKRIIRITTPLILVIISLMAISKVQAMGSVGIGGIPTGGGSSGGRVPSKEELEEMDKAKCQTGELEDGYYKCKYYFQLKDYKTVSMDSTDLTEKSVLDEHTLEIFTAFSAGTWTGIYVKEEKEVTWVSKLQYFTYEEQVDIYTCDCQYEYCWDPWEVTDAATGAKTTYPGGCAWADCGPQEPVKVRPAQKEKPPTCPSNAGRGSCTKTSSTWESTPEAKAAMQSKCIKKSAEEGSKKAKDAAWAVGTMQVKYFTGNDGTQLNDTSLWGTIKSGMCTEPEEVYSSDTMGTYVSHVEYQPENRICINVKTGNVTYDRTECDKDEEIDITFFDYEYDDEILKYWRYFIPLNSKSSDNYYIEIGEPVGSATLTAGQCQYVIGVYRHKKDYREILKVPISKDEPSLSATRKLSGALSTDKNTVSVYGCYIGSTYVKPSNAENCISIIDKNPIVKDYTDLIAPKNGGRLSSDPELAKKQVIEEDGCRFATKINLPIQQNYYSETLKETSNNEVVGLIKGYKFYYRPINIENPFPNGVNEKSYWGRLYNENDNTVRTEQGTYDLSKSFAQVTYVATGDVRSAAIDSKYTSWRGINIDGTSVLIGRGANGITRVNADLEKLYKLGCGPANSSWKECSKET